MSSFEKKVTDAYGPKLQATILAAFSGMPQDSADHTCRKGYASLDSAPYAAVEYFMSAARRGHPLSQSMLALCLELGHGCRRDPDAARKWLQSAAEAGDDTAIQVNALDRLFGDADLTLRESKVLLDRTNRFLSKSTDEQLDEILGGDWRKKLGGG